MIIHKGYIIEATESELWKYYLKQEFDDVMPFDTFLELMRNHNVHIIKDESEGEMSKRVSNSTNDCFAADMAMATALGKRAKSKQTLFDRITASPEALAVEFVGMMYDRVSGEDRYYSMLTGDFYNSYEEAIAATVEKLKEVVE
jgi:hypothetical protein